MTLRSRLKEKRQALLRRTNREARRQERLKRARDTRDAHKKHLRELKRQKTGTTNEETKHKLDRKIEATLISIANAEYRVHRLDKKLTNIRLLVVKTEGQVRRLARKVKRNRRGGPRAALRSANSVNGQTENPPGSNLGPGFITNCQRYTGYNVPPGVFWCGCAVCWWVVKAGLAAVTNRIRLGYTGFIVQDARAGVNGLRAVSISEMQKGDIVVYDFDHIEMVREPGTVSFKTWGGNTSSDNSGSQSNGGGVFPRTRYTSDVICVARPDWGRR